MPTVYKEPRLLPHGVLTADNDKLVAVEAIPNAKEKRIRLILEQRYKMAVEYTLAWLRDNVEEIADWYHYDMLKNGIDCKFF